MQSVLNSISQHSTTLLLACMLMLVVMGVVCFVMVSRTRKLQSRLTSLLDGARGETLERMLYDHLRERVNLQDTVDGIAARLAETENKVGTAKRHVGLVRYDAFDDVGGNQSFALAIFDDHGDGALITSLVGRADCRVYCKPLLAGRSERNLSQEEQRAIQEARSSAPRSILSS